jgi:hypothetical protein
MRGPVVLPWHVPPAVRQVVDASVAVAVLR